MLAERSIYVRDLDRDLERWFSPRPRPDGLRAAVVVLATPGLLAAFLLRVQLRLARTPLRKLCRLVSLLNLRLTGAEFVPGCVVGPGLVLPHPQGIVIGLGARIGNNCTVLQHVTMGERYSQGSRSDHSYPTVGDDVLLAAGAVLLGAITVGSGAIVAANAVVLENVPTGALAVGVPARVVIKDRA